MPDIRLRPATTQPTVVTLGTSVDSRADIRLRPTSGSDITLVPNTRPVLPVVAGGGGNSTLAGAMTQAAGVMAGTLAERFIASGAMAQAASVESGTLREVFAAAGTMAQAASVLSGTLREDFIVAGAVTQAAAVIAGTLNAAPTTTTLAGAMTQAPAVIAGTLAVPASESPPSDTGWSEPREPAWEATPQVELAGAMTQPPARMAGTLETIDNEDWLLGLFVTDDDLVLV